MTVQSKNPGAAKSEDRLPLILSFLLPVVIMVGIFAGKGIYPFGENSFLRTDLYHQYAPFFAEFARALKEGESLTYSFEIGLGSNYVALMAYYLASPFNWLLLLVPSGFVIEFMTYLIVFKIGLCGLTMAGYLKKKYQVNSLLLPFFGVCYAMCGYLAAYSWNIMWLDCLWLAPLILLGLERLVREDRPFLYCITLGLAILSNYYISVLLLPAAKALMTTASADSTFPSTLTSYFSILEMLARQMMNVEVEIGLEHWPNLYSGVVCLLCFPAYILNKEIPAKQKIVKSTLLMVMLLSFSLNIPNYIWHGMHYPNSLPCRQYFLYTILLLTMCFEGFRGLRQLRKEQIAGIFCGVMAFILICQVVVTADEFDYYVYYLTLLFVALYALIAYMWRSDRLARSTALILSLALVVAETGINMASTSVTTTSRTDYWSNTENYQTLLEQAEADDTSGFYRVEKVSRRTKNDGAWVGYQSASIFSSTTQAAVSDFYTIFGMEGNTNAYSFTGATPLMASLLSVRYQLSTTQLEDSELYECIGWEDTTYLYENLYTLNVGFMIADDVSDYFSYYSGDPAAAQNALVNLTTGSGNVLNEIAESSGSSLSLEVTEAGHIYVYVANDDVEDVTAYVNSSTKSFSNVDRGYLLDLGICEVGDVISLSSDEGLTLDATVYLFDDEVFIDWYNRMSEQSFQVESCTNSLTETSLTGTVTATEDGTLFLSIPYDEGWTVTVDGEEVEASAFADTFLSLNLTAGTHTISLHYHVVGLTAGAVISLVSLAILVFLAVLLLLSRRNRRLRQQRRRQERAARLAAAAAKYAAQETDSEDTPTERDGTPLTEETWPTPVRSSSLEEAPLTDDEIAEILLEDDEYLEPPAETPEENYSERQK
ncbi:MAG: YfhO family protein [Lachnospiraceae bacterium]|nr:YfhO family protein [Lachnospiraceae bacterium]